MDFDGMTWEELARYSEDNAYRAQATLDQAKATAEQAERFAHEGIRSRRHAQWTLAITCVLIIAHFVWSLYS